jgi:hypothetical protein
MPTIIENGKEMVPLFVLPGDPIGLLVCILQFLVVVGLIVLLEKIWIRRIKCVRGYERCIHRILLWEFGTVVALIAVYVAKFYCVVLPLLFLLAFLAMWYLVRVLGRG